MSQNYLEIENRNFMPLNTSKSRKENFGFEKNESKLRGEIDQLKNLLEIKEGELKSALEAPFLKEEILRIREKISKEQEEYEKIKETREKEKELEQQKEKQQPAAMEEKPLVRRQAAQAQLKTKKTAGKAKDPDISHHVAVLVSMAFNKGIYQAVKSARDLNNPYLLDRFHDTLVNELYDQLVKQKKIKPIK
ncbi:hypothetical protein KJ695_02020 [Patescibacteria group bacterium]|nr:hypothetical protein [Patescibacteria group bacterium]MBU4056667.1 hypothetical protein [Patescibacteria group bacterium]MBU4368146.1 hypothetical protein [Patescibacteria group bacterium]